MLNLFTKTSALVALTAFTGATTLNSDNIFDSIRDEPNADLVFAPLESKAANL
jgi:hypothetical protein